jgi:HD-GYP domain-containing protein (c-di-GMP phosphodiesterase class II)
VITLADCLDAMLSDRAYRQALPLAKVIQEIRENSPRQFDPAVVAAFFQILEIKGPDFFINSSQVVDRNEMLSKLGEDMVGVKRFLKKCAVGDSKE